MDTMKLKRKNEVDAKCIALVIMAQHIKLDAIIKCVWAEVLFCEV
jgi:ribosomal protein S27AE